MTAVRAAFETPAPRAPGGGRRGAWGDRSGRSAARPRGGRRADTLAAGYPIGVGKADGTATAGAGPPRGVTPVMGCNIWEFTKFFLEIM